MKTSYYIHSLAPVKDKVEISQKPMMTQNKKMFNSGGEETARWYLDGLPDWECAPAMKVQGDIFRIIPATDYA